MRMDVRITSISLEVNEESLCANYNYRLVSWLYDFNTQIPYSPVQAWCTLGLLQAAVIGRWPDSS